MYKRIITSLIILICIGMIFWMLYPNIIYNTSDKKNSTPKTVSEIVQLRFGHDMPINSAQHIAAKRYADIINYKSEGKIKIVVFPDQQLGTDQQMIKMARNGQLAITIPPTSKMTTLIPEMQILDLPFLFLM